MNENNWSNPCPKYDCRKAACKCGLKYVNIPASLGDDSEGSNVAPKNGAYCNALVFYEANNHVYIYSKEGVPTLIDVDASDISTLEQEVRKAQKDVQELEEDIDDFIYGFDTVASMKSASNLDNGDRVRTYGYYAKNDGGGAYYRVVNSVPSGPYETLGDLLYAELIINNEMNVHQFGAKGDGLTDDQDSINKALNSGASIINFTKNLTYMVKGYEDGQAQGSSREARNAQTGIMLQSNTTINLNFATIKCITNDRTNYNIFTVRDKSNIIIQNGNIVGDVDTHIGSTGEWGHGISIRHSNNIHLLNLYIAKCWGDGITTDASDTTSNYCTNVYITNCICDDNRRQGLSAGGIDGLIVEDSKFINTGQTAYTAPGAGVDMEPDSTRAYNITFNNCLFENNKGGGLHAYGSNCNNIVMSGCKISNNPSNLALNIVMATNCVIRNCVVEWLLDASYKYINLAPGNTIEFENNVFTNLILHVASDRFTEYSKIILKNNNINMTVPAQWNNIIETISSSTINDYEIIIDGCIVRPAPDKAYTGLIETKDEHGCKKLTVSNSTLYYSSKQIKTTSNLIATNNKFVQSKNHAIDLQLFANEFCVIKDNTFEHTGWDSRPEGIINTKQNQPAAILDNVYIIKPAFSELVISDDYVPSRWAQNYAEDSDKLIENNYIWNNIINS